VSFNINLFTPDSGDGKTPSPIGFGRNSPPATGGTASCPSCQGDVIPLATQNGWQRCPYCNTQLQMKVWPVARPSTKAAEALTDQATCFFHPDKAFQACCQRCGRFVCALCHLQLGAESVCPSCFELGRNATASPGASSTGQAEWRHRDVLYDSVALTVGWAWILIWPVVVAAIPTVIVLHIKYRKAPRSSLIPRYGWRFWMAYVGLLWLPALLVIIRLFHSRGRI
jgi:hypothetical protein